MAVAELVIFTEGSDQSDPQTIGQGQVHTIIPVFRGRSGRVMIWVVHSNGNLSPLSHLTCRPASNKQWQLAGPIEYVVSVRNAGADVDTGA